MRTRPSSFWLDFAAYVTWIALAILTAFIALGDDGLSAVARAGGAAAAAGAILLGAIHVQWCAVDRRVPWRWWSIAGQSVLALTAIHALHSQTLAVFLIIIASTAAESGDPRATLRWFIAVNAGLLAVLLVNYSLVAALISFFLFFGFQIFAFAMNQAVASERRTREQLAGVNAELMATRRLLQESARNEERLRISRELHDVAGHRLTALKLNLRALLAKGEVDAERLSLCFELSDELLGDIRSVVHQLRASDEIDVPGALGLLRDQHPDLDVHLDVDPRLQVEGIEIAEAIVRSTQEAITNAVKHGRARHVWITLRQGEDGLTLSVRDDGQGGAPSERAGHGLAGMGERAALLGGALAVERAQGSGWTLTLTFPREVTA